MNDYVTCKHCDCSFFPEEGCSVDDCPKCGRTVEVNTTSMMEECTHVNQNTVEELETLLQQHAINTTFLVAERDDLAIQLTKLKKRLHYIYVRMQGKCEWCDNNHADYKFCVHCKYNNRHDGEFDNWVEWKALECD